MRDNRDRHERQQALVHTDRAGTRAATTVRCGERLVQVHVDDVEIHVARADLAENRVQVGAVVIQQPARVVHHVGDACDVTFEDTERRRVGQHNARRLRSQHSLQRIHVDVAVGSGRNFLRQYSHTWSRSPGSYRAQHRER